jgi:hypothetical protein
MVVSLRRPRQLRRNVRHWLGLIARYFRKSGKPVTVELSGGLLEFTITGEIGAVELARYFDVVRGIEAREPVAPNRIADLTGVTSVGITFSEFHELADKRRGETLKNPIKTAIVAGNDLQFGVMRTFQTLNDNPQITIRVFRDRAQALAWLAE